MGFTKKKVRQLMKLLDDMEEDYFGNNYKATIYGKTYLKTEWREYKEIVKVAIKEKDKLSKNSAKYLVKNKEYNRLMRRISYYRTKENKTENDYIQIEKLRKEIEQYLKEKEEKKEKQKLDKLKKIEEALINLNNYEDRGE